MIKQIKKFQIKLTPFDATKKWNMSTTNNQDLLLMDITSSLLDEPIALEFIDYGSISDSLPTDNVECDIALEQQPDDLLNNKIGLNVSGLFYPQFDPINSDGTYQRVVFSQIKTMFYNQFRDPTKMWGMNNIDFDLSKTKRKISDQIRLFNIPQFIYGDQLVPNTITLVDDSIDDVFSIVDDGNGNLIAEKNLFSHKQEIGNHQNIFTAGSDSICNFYFNNSLIFNSFSGSLSGLMWQMPSTGNPLAPFGTCIQPSDQNITLSGSSMALFNVTLRIRGIIELKPYVGGTVGSDSHINIDGSLPVSTFNTYKLVVSDVSHTYFLNNGVSGPVSVVDYSFVIQMREGSLLTLHADSGGDGTEVYNNSFLSVTINSGDPPILVTQPYIGQFLQMDVVSVIPV